MATDIPGQILPVVDEKRLADPIWYEWFAYIRRFITNAEGPWTAFTPVVIGSSNAIAVTIVNNGCRYRRMGRTVNVKYDFTMTNLNGAIGYPIASLPVSPPFDTTALPGRETVLSGKMLAFQLPYLPGTGVAQFYDNTSPLIVNARLMIAGTYEVT